MQQIRTIHQRRSRSNLEAAFHPVLLRIFENRGVSDISELEHSLGRLLPPAGLKGIDTASEILLRAIVAREKILIVGDFDVDGATATTTAIKGIRLLGNYNVDYLVPNRFSDGYGLSEKVAGRAIKCDPQLVITVDNGIANVAGVELLRQADIKVIITDHHLPAQSLPRADAIVNPNQPGCEFKSKMLAGVGVLFYLLLAVRTAMRDQGLFARTEQPNLGSLLDLVALGTVADMVPLDHNNRILVCHGIARIRAAKACPGIMALITIAHREYAKIVSMDLGFVVAPRLNAAGRLDDISTGIECLLAENDRSAIELALHLDEINQQRRQIENQMQQQALVMVRQSLDAVDSQDAGNGGICLFEPDWHQGVNGLVASRVKDKTGKPVIAFARGEDGWLKGSARSVPGVHIRDLLDSISKKYPDLMPAFGGHAMAAGVTIAECDYQTFADAFITLVKLQLEVADVHDQLLSDGSLHSDQLTLELADILRDAAPWGQAFPAPRFDGLFTVVNQRIVGKLHLKLVVKTDGDALLDAIYFRYIEEGQAVPQLDQVKLLYQLDVNEFRGQRSPQLIVEYLEKI